MDMTAALARYESLGVVASALYGDVYKLRDRATGELVALKHMDLRAAAARLTKDTLRPIEEDVFGEVQTNLKLRALGGHAHVVAMRECVSDDRSVALVTEWCAKGELLEVVNARGSMLPIELAMRYFYQIAQGVAFLHANGVAHRDLSLENVLVDSGDVCKVADFGMATGASRVRATGIGKIHYMAPEACRDLHLEGASYNPFETDMWALGVILLTMLTGQYPFDHALETDAHFRLLASFGIEYLLERFDFGTEGCEDIVDVLSRLLAVDPAMRLTADELLRHECFDVFLVSDDEQLMEEEEENEEDEQLPVMELNPAEEDGPVASVVPPRQFHYGMAGLFSQRRPAAIDTGVNRASCTVVVAPSRRSPLVMKQERAETAKPRAKEPRRCAKKCVFRGMLDGVFHRKKARSPPPSSPRLRR